MRRASLHPSIVREVGRVLSLSLLFGTWAFLTLFPEGGLRSAAQLVERGVVTGVACALLGLAASWPLASYGVIARSPLRAWVLQRRRRHSRALEYRARRRERGAAPAPADALSPTP